MSLKRKRNESNKHADANVCAFCGTNEQNEDMFGKYFISDTICLHTNCLYFASGLAQRGDDSEEIFGFFLEDIEAELNRGRKLHCFYCKKRGATVGCILTTCKKSFHLSCGMENGSLHQFFDNFSSYCRDHKPKQKPLKITDDLYCAICTESIEPGKIEKCLYSPCCKKNVFHKICLQKYAHSAGLYAFRCPLCNNSSNFAKEMKTHGINIPEKDASWELEENAYEELLVKPKCDASICLCPKGRKYSPRKKSGWTLLTCSYCGFHARHKNCEKIKSGVNDWLCEECKAVDDKIAKHKTCSQITEKLAAGKNEIGNLLPGIMCNPSASTSTLCLLPRVVLENCLTAKSSLHSDTCLTSSNSLHPDSACSDEVKADKSDLSDTKPTENTDAFKTVEFDHVLNGSHTSLENCLVAKNSLHPDNAFSDEIIACKSNLSDIKPTESIDAFETVEFDHVLNDNSTHVLTENCLAAKNSKHSDSSITSLNPETKERLSDIDKSRFSANVESIDAFKSVEFDHELNGSSARISEIKEKFGDMGKSSSQSALVVAGRNDCKLGNEAKKGSQMHLIDSISLSKLDDQLVNLRDIKNVTHDSQLKWSKNSSKKRCPKKLVKKIKADHPCCSNSNKNCISSYFGQNCCKRVRL